MIEYQIEILKRLKKENVINYNEIIKITDAFQIASGQGLAIGKTKGMLDFLKNCGEIIVKKDEEIKTILNTKYDLAQLYLSIDSYITIEKDIIFNSYFSR